MKLFYYVMNGGDGSANVIFCESEELAEVLDDSQDEGWGEPSTGFIEGDNLQVGNIRTLKNEIKETIEYMPEEGEFYYNNYKDLLDSLLALK